LRRIEKKRLLLAVERSGSDDISLVVDPIGFFENPAGIGRKQGVQVDHLPVYVRESMSYRVAGQIAVADRDTGVVDVVGEATAAA
jgi:hypothetical protein